MNKIDEEGFINNLKAARNLPNGLDITLNNAGTLLEAYKTEGASLKKFKEDVVKVFKDHGREFPGTIEHFDTDGITLRKDELTTYATLMFLFDEVASLKEQNALLVAQAKLVEYSERIAAGQSILYTNMRADIVANAPAISAQCSLTQTEDS